MSYSTLRREYTRGASLLTRHSPASPLRPLSHSERFHFEPFGDPHQDRKERAEWEAKRLADRQQQQQQQEHTEL